MTTYRKRRGRRSLAAILAAMLMASVLAVVAGSPAQAANTSFEVKVDHDDNAKTDPVRAFAGIDRYDTAVRLAKNFAASRGGLGAVSEIFVASGETLVDSISAAGFAGQVDAPILLTRGDSLHGSVADFIEDYGVGKVYVMGGEAAVAASVLDEIKALTSEPTAERVFGQDRYETAAAAAGRISTLSSWCASSAKSAILINGETDMMSYGVAVQTTAFALQLPVLMTKPGELPEATSEFITDSDVEHVQIIGGAGVVSAAVENAVKSLGVDTVERVPGDSAAAVSVELAKLAGNGCGDALGTVDADRVALVRGNPDGVVAAPVLASSLTGDLVTPLIVDDSLPAAVRDYLAATPQTLGASKLNLGIVAVGGLKAVSQAVMDSALAAAATAGGGLTVRIGAGTDTNLDNATNADDPVRPQKETTDDNGTPDNTNDDVIVYPSFTLFFSDTVDVGDAASTAKADKDLNAALLGKLRDMIEVNGASADVRAVAQSTSGGACDKHRVTVTLDQPLSDGDKISVVKSAHKLGTGADQRTVAPASATVTKKPADTKAPTFTIVGIADADPKQTAFTVTFTDAGGFKAMNANALKADDFEFTKATVSGTEDGKIGTVTHAAVKEGDKSIKVTVPITDNDNTARGLVASTSTASGDKLKVKKDVVEDLAGNKNVSPTATTAIKAQPSPKISAVKMSNLKHTGHASWGVPAGLVKGAERGDTENTRPFGYDGTGFDPGDEITIKAKPDGDAAGAAGNDWTFVFDQASSYSAAKPLDIDVRVDTKGKRVTVRFVNGPASATLGDLLKALNGNDAFAARFTAGFTACDGNPKEPLDLQDERNEKAPQNAEGRTKFAIKVSFSKYVRTVGTAEHAELLADVLKGAADRGGLELTATDSADDVDIYDAAVGGVDDNGVVADSGGGLGITGNSKLDGPLKSVTYYAETASVKNLPKPGYGSKDDRVITAAGLHSVDPSGTDNDVRVGGDTPTNCAADSGLDNLYGGGVKPVAVGYAEDAAAKDANGNAVDGTAKKNCDGVDESRNAASNVRIETDSSVKPVKASS